MALYNGGRNEMCMREHSEVNKDVKLKKKRQKNAVFDFLLGLARFKILLFYPVMRLVMWLFSVNRSVSGGSRTVDHEMFKQIAHGPLKNCFQTRLGFIKKQTPPMDPDKDL